MGAKSSHASYDEQGNNLSIKFLMRIGVLVPAVKTDNVKDFYLSRLRGVSSAVAEKYKPIAKFKGYILKNCEDYTAKFFGIVTHLSTYTETNLYGIIMIFCLSNFDRTEFQNNYNMLLRGSAVHGITYKVVAKDIAPFHNDPEANPWYYLNAAIDHKAPSQQFREMIVA